MPEPLTAGKAFTTLALFSVLRTPMTILPMLIGMVAGGTVAANRLGNFLYADEMETYVKVRDKKKEKEIVKKVVEKYFKKSE